MGFSSAVIWKVVVSYYTALIINNTLTTMCQTYLKYSPCINSCHSYLLDSGCGQFKEHSYWCNEKAMLCKHLKSRIQRLWRDLSVSMGCSNGGLCLVPSTHILPHNLLYLQFQMIRHLRPPERHQTASRKMRYMHKH